MVNSRFDLCIRLSFLFVSVKHFILYSKIFENLLSLEKVLTFVEGADSETMRERKEQYPYPFVLASSITIVSCFLISFNQDFYPIDQSQRKFNYSGFFEITYQKASKTN